MLNFLLLRSIVFSCLLFSDNIVLLYLKCLFMRKNFMTTLFQSYLKYKSVYISNLSIYLGFPQIHWSTIFIDQDLYWHHSWPWNLWLNLFILISTSSCFTHSYHKTPQLHYNSFLAFNYITIASWPSITLQ